MAATCEPSASVKMPDALSSDRSSTSLGIATRISPEDFVEAVIAEILGPDAYFEAIAHTAPELVILSGFRAG